MFSLARVTLIFQYELIEFDDIWLSHAEQYRWLQVDYQIGVFISRSSVNLVTINKIWIMAVLQVTRSIANSVCSQLRTGTYGAVDFVAAVTHTRFMIISCLFQFLNVVVLLFETLFYYLPSIWIVFTFVLWEGLLGGGAYVNTFYRMSTEVSFICRRFHNYV